MTVYGLHVSHEQIHPADLLEAVIRTEQVGFGAAMCSDHFSPWSERQGQSAFAWSWLGAALQVTSLPFGVVKAPGQRYHPAIIAQAIGTLAAMPVFDPPVCWDLELTEHFEEIYLHHVGKQQEGFIDAFGARVLPELS